MSRSFKIYTIDRTSYIREARLAVRRESILGLSSKETYLQNSTRGSR